MEALQGLCPNDIQNTKCSIKLEINNGKKTLVYIFSNIPNEERTRHFVTNYTLFLV